MRIHTLRFAGLGPYRTEQFVDFARLEDDGIYLIAGRTGAGKSTILDAICFALYGSVPRFEGGQAHLRSDHSGPDDPTFAEIEFAAGGGVYRIHRSPEYSRPAKRGGGLTKQAAKAQLLVRRGDEWEGVSSSAREIGSEVLRIVGLTREQFLQVILLAQNRFSEFLLAKNDDRQKLLRTLFATERFEQVRARLTEKRQALGAELETQRALIRAAAIEVAAIATDEGDDERERDGHDRSDGGDGPEARMGESHELPLVFDPEWFLAFPRRFAPLVENASARAGTADEDWRRASAALDAATAVASAQARRDRARTDLAVLDERREAVEQERGVVAAARRAEAVVPLRDAENHAATRLHAATTRLELALTAYRVEFGAGEANTGAADAADPVDAVPASSAPTPASAARRAEELAATLGALDAVLTDEKRLPGARREAESATERVRSIAARIESAEAALAQVPAAIADVDARLEALGDTAALVEPRSEAVSAAAARARAAARLTRALAGHRVLDLDHSKAVAAQRDASNRHADLVDARFRGYSAELAERLSDDEPCPVCGALEHPSPARHADDAARVSQKDIDAARATLQRRTTQMDEARSALSESTAAIAALEAEIGRPAAAIAAIGTADAQPVQAEAADAQPADPIEAATTLEGRLGRELELARELLAEAEAARAEVARLRAERSALVERSETETARLAGLRVELAEASDAAGRAEASLEALLALLETQRAGFESVTARASRLAAERRAAQSYVEASEELNRRTTEREEAGAALDAALAERGFTTRTSLEASIRSAREVRAAEKLVVDFDNRRAAAEAVLAEPEIVALPRETVDLSAPSDALRSATARRDDAVGRLSALQDRSRRLDARVSDAVGRVESTGQRIADFETLRALAEAVDGKGQNTRRMDLEAFALAGRLEEIVDAANLRLRTMSSGRYTLEHDDSLAYRNTSSGLGLEVLDAFTGQRRQPSSLSGGETFLASLALALGLADAVTAQAGGITLETMFIDEGFGSLDPETLEIAMSTLDGLRAGGRSVGLISHVDTMKERVPIGLLVETTERGDSVLRVPAPVMAN